MIKILRVLEYPFQARKGGANVTNFIKSNGVKPLSKINGNILVSLLNRYYFKISNRMLNVTYQYREGTCLEETPKIIYLKILLNVK